MPCLPCQRAKIEVLVGIDMGLTVSCCIICIKIPTTVRRQLEFPTKIEPLKQFAQPPMYDVWGMIICSYS